MRDRGDKKRSIAACVYVRTPRWNSNMGTSEVRPIIGRKQGTICSIKSRAEGPVSRAEPELEVIRGVLDGYDDRIALLHTSGTNGYNRTITSIPERCFTVFTWKLYYPHARPVISHTCLNLSAPGTLNS